MTGEDDPVPVHIQPAIPSRATLPDPPPTQPAPPGRGEKAATTKARNDRKAKRKQSRQRSQGLSATEIRKINRKRAKNMAKRKTKRTPAKPKVAKNPNRPLEMKNRMAAVLSALGTLQKSEIRFFTSAVEDMQGLSRTGRHRVIAALQQVYG